MIFLSKADLQAILKDPDLTDDNYVILHREKVYQIATPVKNLEELEKDDKNE